MLSNLKGDFNTWLYNHNSLLKTYSALRQCSTFSALCEAAAWILINLKLMEMRMKYCVCSKYFISSVFSCRAFSSLQFQFGHVSIGLAHLDLRIFTHSCLRISTVNWYILAITHIFWDWSSSHAYASLVDINTLKQFQWWYMVRVIIILFGETKLLLRF